MIPNSLQVLDKALQRDTARLRSKLQAAAAACIGNEDAEWWGASVIPDSDAFLAAESYSALELEEDEVFTDDPAHAATFLLLVSFALH